MQVEEALQEKNLEVSTIQALHQDAVTRSGVHWDQPGAGQSKAVLQ